MCLFSGNVSHVGSTKIFARGLAGGRQVLVYAMQMAADDEVAMVLPLPVPASSPEDALRFVDLEGYPELFEHMRQGFPEPQFLSLGAPLARGGVPKPATLAVHEVGAFAASFVPTPADFGRLDARFRLGEGVLERLPLYRDWGFAVFKLKTKREGIVARILGGPARPRTFHPMAFEFPRRDASALFFPTVHVHDGAVHAEAEFDHVLYAQADGEGASVDGWEESFGVASGFVDVARARGTVEGKLPCFSLTLSGTRANEDVWARAGTSIAA